jgi:hypothetical protein
MLCGELWQRFTLGFLTRRRSGAAFLSLAFVLLVATQAVCAVDRSECAVARRNSSITGRIAARDLGDARLTDHYYALTGTPGDL